jgi:hypothetical protein
MSAHSSLHECRAHGMGYNFLLAEDHKKICALLVKVTL